MEIIGNEKSTLHEISNKGLGHSFGDMEKT